MRRGGAASALPMAAIQPSTFCGATKVDRLRTVGMQHFAQHRQIGDDHRHSGHGGFGGRKAERLPDRREDEQIGGGVEIGDVLRLQGAEHVQPVVDAERDGKLVERIVHWRRRPRCTRCACGRQASARISTSWFFCAVTPADIEKERLRLRQTETAARRLAVFLRHRRIEAVLDQNHRAPIAPRIARDTRPRCWRC